MVRFSVQTSGFNNLEQNLFAQAMGLAKDGQISDTDRQALQKTAESDGHVDENEKAFLRALSEKPEAFVQAAEAAAFDPSAFGWEPTAIGSTVAEPLKSLPALGLDKLYLLDLSRRLETLRPATPEALPADQQLLLNRTRELVQQLIAEQIESPTGLLKDLETTVQSLTAQAKPVGDTARSVSDAGQIPAGVSKYLLSSPPPDISGGLDGLLKDYRAGAAHRDFSWMPPKMSLPIPLAFDDGNNRFVLPAGASIGREASGDFVADMPGLLIQVGGTTISSGPANFRLGKSLDQLKLLDQRVATPGQTTVLENFEAHFEQSQSFIQADKLSVDLTQGGRITLERARVSNRPDGFSMGIREYLNVYDPAAKNQDPDEISRQLAAEAKQPGSEKNLPDNLDHIGRAEFYQTTVVDGPKPDREIGFEANQVNFRRNAQPYFTAERLHLSFVSTPQKASQQGQFLAEAEGFVSQVGDLKTPGSQQLKAGQAKIAWTLDGKGGSSLVITGQDLSRLTPTDSLKIDDGHLSATVDKDGLLTTVAAGTSLEYADVSKHLVLRDASLLAQRSKTAGQDIVTVKAIAGQLAYNKTAPPKPNEKAPVFDPEKPMALYADKPDLLSVKGAGLEISFDGKGLRSVTAELAEIKGENLPVSARGLSAVYGRIDPDPSPQDAQAQDSQPKQVQDGFAFGAVVQNLSLNFDEKLNKKEGVTSATPLSDAGAGNLPLFVNPVVAKFEKDPNLQKLMEQLTVGDRLSVENMSLILAKVPTQQGADWVAQTDLNSLDVNLPLRGLQATLKTPEGQQMRMTVLLGDDGKVLKLAQAALPQGSSASGTVSSTGLSQDKKQTITDTTSFKFNSPNAPTGISYENTNGVHSLQAENLQGEVTQTRTVVENGKNPSVQTSRFQLNDVTGNIQIPATDKVSVKQVQGHLHAEIPNYDIDAQLDRFSDFLLQAQQLKGGGVSLRMDPTSAEAELTGTLEISKGFPLKVKLDQVKGMSLTSQTNQVDFKLAGKSEVDLFNGLVNFSGNNTELIAAYHPFQPDPFNQVLQRSLLSQETPLFSGEAFLTGNHHFHLNNQGLDLGGAFLLPPLKPPSEGSGLGLANNPYLDPPGYGAVLKAGYRNFSSNAGWEFGLHGGVVPGSMVSVDQLNGNTKFLGVPFQHLNLPTTLMAGLHYNWANSQGQGTVAAGTFYNPLVPVMASLMSQEILKEHFNGLTPQSLLPLQENNAYGGYGAISWQSPNLSTGLTFSAGPSAAGGKAWLSFPFGQPISEPEKAGT